MYCIIFIILDANLLQLTDSWKKSNKIDCIIYLPFLNTRELGNQSRTDDSVAISVRQSRLNREKDVIKKQEDSEDKCDDNLNYGSFADDRVSKKSEGERENPIAFRLVGT